MIIDSESAAAVTGTGWVAAQAGWPDRALPPGRSDSSRSSQGRAGRGRARPDRLPGPAALAWLIALGLGRDSDSEF